MEVSWFVLLPIVWVLYSTGDTDEDIDDFMHNYLRLDGVFCMRLILKNTNDAIGTYAGLYSAYQHVNINVGNFCKFLERLDLTACVTSRCTSYILLTQYYGLFCVSIINS